MKALTVRNAGEGIEIPLYDLIGHDWWSGEGITAKAFREAIKPHKGKPLNLRINSPGGSVFEASAIMAALDDHKGRVEVDVDGVAASAASFLMMAADHIRVGSNALVMIHEPHGGVMGTADEMRHQAGLLEKIRDQIIDAYERHSRAGRDQLAAWMAEETWFTGQEAVEAGLAHETTAPIHAAALAQYAPAMAKLQYRRTPKLPDLWQETRERQEIAARLGLHSATQSV